MKCLLFLPLFVTTVIGLYDVDPSPYLKDSLLCRPWTCISEKLGISNRPSQDQFPLILKSLLPEGPWKATAKNVVEKCYGDNSRRYTNTCPGQALLHCVIDNLNKFCPQEFTYTEDACAPISCMAGFKYMFSQSRFDNLQHYIPTERRPAWFLQNYFSETCCSLPEMFNSSVLTECGFNSIIHYYGHKPTPAATTTTTRTTQQSTIIYPSYNYRTTTEHEFEEDDDPNYDPLDCCDFSELLTRDTRLHCDFNVTWSKQRRLSVLDEDGPVTTTTSKPVQLKNHDVKVVPLSCEKETCIFSKLEIIKDGQIDTKAYSKLLDSFIRNHPDWRSARARVETACITKPLKDYEADCEINKLLACTFDVLSENCPHRKSKDDPCRHTTALNNDTICQINSSKYKPRNRRQFCDFPQFVSHDVLAQCGARSVNRIESVPEFSYKKVHWSHKWAAFKPACKDTTPSMTCVLKDLGVLNKYNFLDYFAFKGRLNRFMTTHLEWGVFKDVIINYFNTMPMYKEFCMSPKRMLNVMDVMLQNCPPMRRQKSKICMRIFDEMKHLPTSFARDQPHTSDHRQHLSLMFAPLFKFPRQNKRHVNVTMYKNKESILDHSMLRTANVPPVTIMNIKPYRMHVKKNEKPLVRTPVYMKYASTTRSSVSVAESGPKLQRPINNDGVWRSDSVAESGPKLQRPINNDGVWRSGSVAESGPKLQRPINNDGVWRSNLKSGENGKENVPIPL